MKHDQPPEAVVSRETGRRLQIYAEILVKWSATVNLVARGDLAHVWDRHIDDCLQLLPLLPAGGEFADLGSGAGLPGLVLAIASGRAFHLIEADQRKAAFLREAARETAASVTVHAQRIDNVVLPPLQLITARALAPLDQLCAWSAPRLASSGTCLFLKGARIDAELRAAAMHWRMHVRRWQSRTDPGGTVVQLSEISPHAAN